MTTANRIVKKPQQKQKSASTVQATTQPKLMTEKQASAYLGASTSYLQKSRSEGNPTGNRTPPPPHIKINGSVKYAVDDCDEWLDAQQRHR